MESRIMVGTIILRDDLAFPKSIAIQSAAYCAGWLRIKEMSTTVLDRTLRSAGWNRFYIAGAMRTLELGNGKDACVRRGIARLAARAKASNFNCLQVTGVTQKSSFGIPFVSFSANACHIQEGTALAVGAPPLGSARSRFIKSLW
jgi:hypothetical protein